MLLDKKRKKKRFWVLRRRQQRGEFNGVDQDHKCFLIYFRIGIPSLSNGHNKRLPLAEPGSA